MQPFRQANPLTARPALGKRSTSKGPTLLATRYSLPATSTAFTLVELLVGMTLALMVMTAVLSSYVFLGKNFTRTLGISSANQPPLEAQGRRAVAYFTQDVRAASGRTGTISASEITLILPTSSGTKNVTYYFNTTAAAVSVYSVTVPANSLARIDRSTSTSLTLQTNLLNTTAAPSVIIYADSAGNPYTTYVNHLPGIKYISFTLSAQAGSSVNGTLTQVYQVTSAPLLLRNTPLLY